MTKSLISEFKSFVQQALTIKKLTKKSSTLLHNGGVPLRKNFQNSVRKKMENEIRVVTEEIKFPGKTDRLKRLSYFPGRNVPNANSS